MPDEIGDLLYRSVVLCDLAAFYDALDPAPLGEIFRAMGVAHRRRERLLLETDGCEWQIRCLEAMLAALLIELGSRWHLAECMRRHARAG